MAQSKILRKIITSLIPKKKVCIPQKSSYTKSYTSFSGADMICFVDKKPIGEIAAVSWNEDIIENKVEGILIIYDFGHNIESELKNKVFDLVIIVQNEYPPILTRTINGIKVNCVSGGLSMDDIVTEIVLKFTAEGITDYRVISAEELRQIKGRDE
jgi:hypothetical protein